MFQKQFLLLNQDEASLTKNIIFNKHQFHLSPLDAQSVPYCAMRLYGAL